MCYTYLSVLNDILSDGEIAKLKEYFIGLTPNTIALITVSKVANALNIDTEKAIKVILKCEEKGFLKRHFGIRCPKCGALIKEIESPNIDDIIINECYSCDEHIEISSDDIVVLFELIKVELPFEMGQQSKQIIRSEASVVAPEDTYKEFKNMCKKMNILLERQQNKSNKDDLRKKEKDRNHKKAVRKSENNRKIKIVIKIVCVIISVIVIFLVYRKYGFEKISIFVAFCGFVVPFICNYIVDEVFITDIGRIEERMIIKK